MGELGRYTVHVGLLFQSVGVAGHQGLDAPAALVAEILARKHLDGVGADGADVLEDALARALAQGHHRNHRGDADDDAQHGQEGAQTMGGHGQEGHAHGLAELIPARAPGAPRLPRGLAPLGGVLLPILAGTPVGDYLTVAYLDDPLGVGRHLGVVGHDDHGMPLAVQLFQQLHHFLAAAPVQGPGGLVGQDQAAAVHQGPRDADTLLLATGELARAVIEAIAQAQPP